MSIIDFEQIREQREAPDADCLLRDQWGRPMGLFGFEYQVDGRTFSFKIEAYTQEEAEKHLVAIRQSAEFVGQLSRVGDL